MPKKIILDVNGEVLKADGVAGGVKIEFDNGETKVLMLAELSPSTLARAAAHGISQKMGDSYAGAKDEPDPVAFAIGSVSDVAKALLAGDWRTATTGTGGSRTSDFARAVAAVTQKDLAEVVDALAEMTDEQKKPFKDHPLVKAKLAEIKAESAIARAAKLGKAAEGVEALKL